MNTDIVIEILANRRSHEIDEIKAYYHYTFGSDLLQDAMGKASGLQKDFRDMLMAIILGRVGSEAFWVREATHGMGTNELLLTEAIMGRQNYDLNEMKR